MTWGKTPWGTLYNGVFPTGRLWQSVIEPLHPKMPGVAFEDPDGRGIVLSRISTTGENVVLTDRTDEAFEPPYGLELRFYGVDPDLSPTVPLFGLEKIWALPSYESRQKRETTVSFHVSAAKGNARDQLAAQRLPVAFIRSEVSRQGKQFIMSEESSIFYRKPGRITWAIPQVAKGKHRIELRLRQSSYDPNNHDMAPADKVYIDGKEQQLDWVKWSSACIGQAYFATVLTPPLTLDGTPHTLTVETTMDWCAVSPPFTLRPEAAIQPTL
jgi:hypothetical protein